jgi:hypothetical protein
VPHPSLQAFVAQIRDGLALAQVLIRRTASGVELRHLADRDRAAGTLRELALTDLRALAQFTATGAFRPLKSAPDLQNGWVFRARDDAQLEGALNQLYPGAVADWFAAHSPTPPVTHYREFAARQTGMYRITTMLTDSQAAQVIRACCHKGFCLKQRLWTVDGLTTDAADEKSLIPCLEPCAVLLEFARKAVRIEQEEKVELPLSQSEALSLEAALRTALEHPDREAPAGDFAAPANPRRLQLLLEKLAALPIKTTVKAED